MEKEIRYRHDLSTFVCMQYDIKCAYYDFRRSLVGNETEQEMFSKEEFVIWEGLVTEFLMAFGVDERIARKIVSASQITMHWHTSTLKRIEMDLRYLTRYFAESVK